MFSFQETLAIANALKTAGLTSEPFLGQCFRTSARRFGDDLRTAALTPATRMYYSGLARAFASSSSWINYLRQLRDSGIAPPEVLDRF